MLTLNSILSVLRRHRPRSSSGLAHEWYLILISSSIILVGIVVWSAWIFDTALSDRVVISPADSAPVINQTSLDLVYEVFATRAEEEKKYIQGIYRYSDPSQ